MKICTTENEYITAIAPAVQRACKALGYLPSVLIGQSCLENGYGIEDYWDNPQIAMLMEANNMVGLKSELLNSSWSQYTVWPGKSLTKQTPEVYNGKKVTITDNFRIYDTIEQSFCDFLLFIKYASNNSNGNPPKYGDSVLSIKDPQTLITTVANKGYATGTTYPTSVMKIVNKHNLTKYDDLSNVQPSTYIVKGGSSSVSNTVKLASRSINDITSANLSQVPASRGSNSISFIVVHYLGVPNADNPYLYGGGYGGHYNIKRDGSIYLAANPRTAVVWHCGGGLQGSGGHSFHGICGNYNSIGIECGVCYTDTSVKSASGDSNQWYFTEETQESLVWLVSKLMDEYGISADHVIRHYDVTGKICPNPYVKNNNLKTSWTWDQFKANLAQYRSNGTITIPNGSSSSTTPSTPSSSSSTTTGEISVTKNSGYPATPFTVRVIIDDLNMRQGPSTSYSSNGYTKKGSFTIVEVKGDWGKLKSGAGWIYLKNPSYCTILGDSTTSYTYKYNGLTYNLVFDANYYTNKYADLKKAFGTDATKLFTHFCQYGMKEGRQAISTFNVNTYKKNYTDLQKAFGSNLPEYYKHYIQYGNKEKRKAI